MKQFFILLPFLHTSTWKNTVFLVLFFMLFGGIALALLGIAVQGVFPEIGKKLLTLIQ
jgi:hypothetical protein